MTEGTLAPYRRRAITATGAGLLIVAVLVYGNQGLATWRAHFLNHASASYREPVAALNSLQWRLVAQHGGPEMKLWLSQLVHNLALVILAALFIHLATRGVAARRGRWSVFVGCWGATIIAAALAGAVSSPLAVLGSGRQLNLHPYAEERFYSLVSQGLLLGLLVGVLVGLAGVFAYRSAPDPESITSPTYEPTLPMDSDATTSLSRGSDFGGYGYDQGDQTTVRREPAFPTAAYRRPPQYPSGD